MLSNFDFSLSFKLSVTRYKFAYSAYFVYLVTVTFRIIKNFLISHGLFCVGLASFTTNNHLIFEGFISSTSRSLLPTLLPIAFPWWSDWLLWFLKEIFLFFFVSKKSGKIQHYVLFCGNLFLFRRSLANFLTIANFVSKFQLFKTMSWLLCCVFIWILEFFFDIFNVKLLISRSCGIFLLIFDCFS